MNRLIALALTIVVLTFTNGVLAEQEKLYGIWINMDYEYPKPGKFNFKPDSKFERFRYAESKVPYREGIYKIAEKWTDSHGNNFYKIQKVDELDIETKSLFKISKSGKSLEFVWGYYEYPTEVVPKPGRYLKYNRE